MSRSGAQCPLCQAIMTMEDLRLDGRAGRLGEVMTAVVVDGPKGKEYRLPTEREIRAARVEQADLDTIYAEIPFGLPDEPTPKAGIGASRAFSIDGYGFDKWRTLFSNRPTLGTRDVCGRSPESTRRERPSGRKHGGRRSPQVWRRLSAAWLIAEANCRRGPTIPNRSATRSLVSHCR